MRSPGIHIIRKDFEDILKELEIKGFPTETFFRMAKRKAILTRSLEVKNNKVNKRVSNITLATIGDAALVADIIYATRIKLKHRGVKKINESSVKDWTLCKKLAQVCNTFCQDFELDTREGFITYIEIGIHRMNNNHNLLQRLISMADNITEQYAAQLDMQTDSDKQLTKSIHDYYVNRIADTTGIQESYEKQPEKYINFINLKNLLLERGWDYKIYIDAQFEGLAWCNGIPEIEQLCSDKSIQRLNKYLYKNKNHRSQEPETKGSIWDLINK